MEAPHALEVEVEVVDLDLGASTRPPRPHRPLEALASLVLLVLLAAGLVEAAAVATGLRAALAGDRLVLLAARPAPGEEVLVAGRPARLVATGPLEVSTSPTGALVLGEVATDIHPPEKLAATLPAGDALVERFSGQLLETPANGLSRLVLALP
jgi:hypothetical protein